jgi:GNAT superfamily N-acetyltransferase
MKASAKSEPLELKFKPLKPDRWSDFELLFGERGACGGCWCMYWRLDRKRFSEQKGAKNKAAMKRLVSEGRIPGILAYARTPASNGRARWQPVGWCSVAPRTEFPALGRSRILKPIDEREVWSVACLFVAKPFRRRGVTVGLLRAAAEYVAQRGGQVVEGYPIDPKQASMPDVFAWTGLESAFSQAGFAECARRSETRPIMRIEV